MIIDDIALTMQPRIGQHTAAHLLSCFESAERLYASTADEIVERSGLNRDLATQIASKSCHKKAEAELSHCRKNGIMPIPSDSEFYPALLRECNDYPHVLYFRGDPASLGQRRMLSIVGTRRMTSYGQKVCEKLTAELAEMYPELVIVSGLAHGVDGASHRAALAFSLATVAVLPGHVSQIYPSQHARLAEEMIERGGGILSEYNSGTKMIGVTFLARNRIIAGMSVGTLIVESALKGGSMITASLAHGYDRSVMAIPGRIGDLASEGPNRLIATEKARIVCSGEDIARELGWDIQQRRPAAQKQSPSLSPQAILVMERIADGETVSIDAIAEATGLPMSELSPLLFELEFEGAVRALPGKLYEKNFQ